MKHCPNCSRQVDDAALVCNHCGREWRTGVTPSAVDRPSGTTEDQATAGPDWPWWWLAAIVISGLLITQCYYVRQVMH